MHTWIKELLTSLDDLVDEKTKQKVLERCGEKCPFSHMPDEQLMDLRKKAADEQEFLNQLSDQWRLTKEDGQYYVVFDQCYCPLVNKDIKEASQTMCYCTLGNLKRKFSISLGRTIEVEMRKTVLAGDDECRFRVLI